MIGVGIVVYHQCSSVYVKYDRCRCCSVSSVLFGLC